MKKLLWMVVAVLAITSAAQAQAAPHKAVITWTASSDAASNPTLFYNIYRAVGVCPASGSPATLAKLASTLALATTYTDSASLLAGQSYCYVVRASLNGSESADSNAAGGVVPLAGATGVSVVMQ